MIEQVIVMKDGNAFGELSLTKARLQPRLASILCLTECHLALMSKDDYNKVLAKI